MDGTLRRVSDHTREGILYDCRVPVFHGDDWCFAAINSQGHTEVCPRVASFAAGARRVRAWVETRQPPAIAHKAG